MAVITISRQVAALGDEIASALAEKLGYVFIDRKEIEKRIVDLGFSEEKLKKYDERKPGFFASLAKDRDEYLDYVQTAILEVANQNNCILIGRGAFAILENVPNVIAVRFVANDDIRKERLMKEFSWDEKKALQRIQESDANNRAAGMVMICFLVFLLGESIIINGIQLARSLIKRSTGDGSKLLKK